MDQTFGDYTVGQPAPPPQWDPRLSAAAHIAQALSDTASSYTPETAPANLSVRALPKPSPLEAYIEKALKEQQGGGEDVGPSTFDVYKFLRQKAAEGPTPEDVQTGKAGVEAKAAKALSDKLAGIPTPQRALNTAPYLPELQLPAVPTRTKPGMEPISSLMAAILGLVSPQNAGQFGAAAIQGSLAGNQRDYEDAQAGYQQAFQRNVALHADEIRRRNAQAEIDNENKGIAYNNSLATTQRQKEDAIASGNTARTEGISKFLDDIAAKTREPRKAASEADVALEQHKEELRLQEGKERRFLTAAEIASRLQEQRTRAEEIKAAKEANLLERTRQHNLEDEHRKEMEKIASRGQGYMMGPGGVVMPIPVPQLPYKVQAGIQHEKNQDAIAAARLQMQKDKQTAGTDTIAQRAIINSQLNAFKTQVHDTRKAIADYDKIHPWDERKNNEDMRARMGVLTQENQRAEATFNEYNRQADELKARLKTNMGIKKKATVEPPRPANVPDGYTFNANGPKGAGWYKP